MDTIIYARGLVACSVCAPASLDRERVEFETNFINPTGITSRWTIADEAFNDGTPNPIQCLHDPTRLHYLLTC